MKSLGNDWDEIIKDEITQPYYLELRDFLKNEYARKRIYPPMEDIYSALRMTSYSDTKVVILGQDPYINPGEAHGMAFSVKIGARVPPSLQNIFKELHADLGVKIPSHGYLVDWAKQGVLLLNTTLTVEAGKSRSHANKGWEKLTTYIIQQLDNKQTPIVFMLWGRDAQTKLEIIKNPVHMVLTAAHPSPLAGGRFFGSKHFSQANKFLLDNGIDEINWEIKDVN
ncbi:MAG: uracil-DNA glycosylase [Firmicutes bacterium]|nr:uracil-DNA glycosylase [Bacillota bacterium]